MATTRPPFWVTVAWTVTKERAIDPHKTRVDIGERHTFETVRVPRACVWVRDGGEADVQQAKSWAAGEEEDVQVFVFPAHEQDPQGAAKRSIMASQKIRTSS